MKRHWFISAILVLVAGCTMMPKYERPPPPVADSWPDGVTGTNAASIGDLTWHEFFKDPPLRQLIGLSLTNNRDLRIAALHVEEVRAQYQIQRAYLFPDFEASARGTRQHFSASGVAFGKDFSLTTYDVSLNVSYEVDLFGRIRSLKKEALERYFASEEGRRATQVALVSQVASQYLTLLQLQDALALTRQTFEAVQSSYKLNQRSFEAGVASELDFRTAEAQVQTARVNLVAIQQLFSQARNALVLLVGQPLPEDLSTGPGLSSQTFIADVAEGLPSELIERRPDILSAEHLLMAANANIGAARAAFFPRILLTGSAGTVSAKLEDLFTGPSAAWSFSPQIQIPIFQGLIYKANLDISHVRRQIEIANYEKAIQTAFREVADVLAIRSLMDEKTAAQESLVQAQQKRFTLTEARYRQGVDNYIAVLLTQQDLFASQIVLLQFRAARLQNLVDLYRSLGGGWKSDPSLAQNN